MHYISRLERIVSLSLSLSLSFFSPWPAIAAVQEYSSTLTPYQLSHFIRSRDGSQVCGNEKPSLTLIQRSISWWDPAQISSRSAGRSVLCRVVLYAKYIHRIRINSANRTDRLYPLNATKRGPRRIRFICKFREDCLPVSNFTQLNVHDRSAKPLSASVVSRGGANPSGMDL